MVKVNVNVVYDYIKREKITKTEFCKRCNIGYATLQKLLSGNVNFSLPVVRKVLLAMKIYIEDLFDIKYKENTRYLNKKSVK